jgi:RNA polymerase sigma factor (sigma-70 family)
MLRTQSDGRLVDLVRAGHASAFEAIVQRYRKPLLGYCSRLLPASRAEDAVQQTFLKAYQAMVSGDAELNLRPWLYRIAHNASLNLLRQNGWTHEQLDENLDGVQRPDQALELRERLRATVEAVKRLPERQRDAVLLREVEGLSYEEIATAMGVGDGAVRQLLHRARSSLRAGLTAVTPVGLVDRLAAALASTGGDPGARVAELATGAGLGAGAVKLSAAVLATGVIATGAVTVPLAHHSRHAKSSQADTAEASALHASSGDSSSPPATKVDDRSGSGRSGSNSGHRGRHRGSGGHSHSGRGSGERHDSSNRGGGDRSHSEPVSEHHSGSGGGTSGGDDHHSGSGRDGGGSGESGSGSGELSGGTGGSDDTTLSGGDDRSGSGGGDQTLTAPTGTTGPMGAVTDDSGKDGGGSGSSGGDSSSGSN